MTDFGVTVAAPKRGSPCISSVSGTSAPDMQSVRALWAASWRRLEALHSGLEARLPDLPRAGKVARLESAAARQAGRAIRGGAPELSEFKKRLAAWEAALAAALAAPQVSAAGTARPERPLLSRCGFWPQGPVTVLPDRRARLAAEPFLHRRPACLS